MTRTDRIEAAARARSERIKAALRAWHETWNSMDPPTKNQQWDAMGAALDAAFPELAGDSPTAWLAPIEPTEEMWGAGDRECNDDEPLGTVWTAMRQTYLKDT